MGTSCGLIGPRQARSSWGVRFPTNWAVTRGFWRLERAFSHQTGESTLQVPEQLLTGRPA
jgi:hypothetical protein